MPERQQDSLAVSEISLILQEWREGIIRSVLTEGLKPGSVLSSEGKNCLLSEDDRPSSLVHGRVFNGRSRSLAGVLYSGGSSPLLVISEREGLETWYRLGRWQSLSEEEISNIEKRFSSSLLVLCYLDRIRENLKNFGKALGPENFLRMVFPAVIYDQLSPDTKVAIAESEVDIDVVRGFIMREIPDDGEFPNAPRFRVPNYEKALRRMMNELDEPLWVHGVRLPIGEDVEMMSRKP